MQLNPGRGRWAVRLAALLGLLMMLLTVAPGSLGTAAWADDKPADSVKGKTFIIATDTTFAPFEYRNAQGDMTGIDMDLIQSIAKREGFSVTIKSVGFDAALQAVQARQADGVIAGMSITDERRKVFDFSDPYFASGIQMAVKSSDSSIKSYADLKGKTVVAKTGTESLSFAQSISGKYGFTVKALDKADTMYSEVNTGNAAAVFDDYPVLAYGIAQGDGLKVVTPKEEGASYGFAVLKGSNAGLLQAFNTGLAQMKADGSYHKLLVKYLGDNAPADDASVSAVKGKTFIIATDTTFAPFEYRDAQGDMTGIDMDLIREIAKRQGFNVSIKSVGFDAALQAVKARQADGVIAGMSITDERKKVFDFSDPYFDSGIQMAVAKDSDITGYADLKGKTVVAKTGTESLSFAQSISGKYGFTVKALDKADTMYSEVNTGNAAAVFDDYPVLAYGIAQGNGLKVVTAKEAGASYGFAVLKGSNAALLQAFNAGLSGMKTDGSYQQVLDKYLKAPDLASEANESFWALLVESFPALMKGLGMTVAATALSLVIALVLGIVFGFCKVSGVKVLQIIASVYVAIFRGTPLLVQAFFFYFGLPAATGQKIGVFTAGVMTLALNAGAYMTEIVRGGIQSVDPGQMEASRSLGLNWMQSMRKVIVPQAVKIMTPSFINQFVISLKDTSILAVLGFAELTYQGQQIIARNFRSFDIWIMVGVIYFIVIYALTTLSNFVDRRINK